MLTTKCNIDRLTPAVHLRDHKVTYFFIKMWFRRTTVFPLLAEICRTLKSFYLNVMNETLFDPIFHTLIHRSVTFLLRKENVRKDLNCIVVTVGLKLSAVPHNGQKILIFRLVAIIL